MKTCEEHRTDLLGEPDGTLETLIDMRFVWQDSVTGEEREDFYTRQRVAEEILAQRRGIHLPVKKVGRSIWL